MPKGNSGKENNGKGGMKAVVIVGAAIIVALVGVIGVLLAKQGAGSASKEEGGRNAVERQNGPAVEEKRNVVVNQQNAEEAADDLLGQEYVEPGYYDAKMTTTWHFRTGDAVSDDAYVANDAGNTNDVYFDVFIVGNEETPILESPVIPRGSEFKDIALDKPLEAGTYDCVAVYHLVDGDQKTISTLRVGLTIIVGQ